MSAPIPRALEAERTVLGAVLVDPTVWPAVADRLHAGDFADQRHRAVWTALSRLALADRPADLVTLKDALQATDDLATAGGPAYVAGLLDGVPRITEGGVTAWAGLVREAAQRREVVARIDALKRLADSGERSATELLDKAQATFLEAAAPARGGSFGPDELARIASRELERLALAPDGLVGVTWGLPGLDALTGGLQPGQLVVIGARPSRGKSSLGLQVAEAASGAGAVVMLASLEMGPEEVAVRRVCTEAGVSATWIRGNGANSRHWPGLTAGLARTVQRPLYLEELTAPTVPQIHARAKRLQARAGLGVVVIDYLQLCRATTITRGANRDQELGEVSRGLKAMARRLGVPVVVAAQLNRKAEDRAEGRPHLADFRECGSIEADADVAVLCWWKSDTGDDAELLIAKNRNGPTGSVAVRFNRELARFEEAIPMKGPRLRQRGP
ncbi:MAG: AAA family ATPase [Vicinamibacteria bacterium]|nr:AAA family ATPase [Vicinamibacteria bacterium]